MKMKYVSVALTAGLALGLTLGCVAQADTSTHESSSSQAAPRDGQARLAETTQKLEDAFADQFVHGRVDRSSLAAPIGDVVKAMPEAARPKVQQHIDQVLDAGEKLTSTMTPEQRAALATPPAAEKVGKTQQAQLAAWGWPGTAGWGGYGAFGFPNMYTLGGLNCGVGLSTWCGAGWNNLGAGGWFW
jgi:hypothetical protein